MFCAFKVLGSRQENKQNALFSIREEPGGSNDCLSGTKGLAAGHLQRQSQPHQVGEGTGSASGRGKGLTTVHG